MKKQYSSLFKILVDAYMKDTLETEVEKLLSNKDVNKNDLAKIISSLCGVDVDFSSHYIDDLKKAICSYNAMHKIVSKVKTCSMDCSDEDGKTICQKSCPFDAILLSEKTNSTYIDTIKCTECGFCIEACPTGSILDKVEFLPIVELLKGDTPVIATVAPAITGQFGHDVNMDQLRTAFKKIGFADMLEVAFFADMLTLKEAFEFNEHVHTKDDLMITSCCCPMWVAMVRRVYSDLIKYVSPSVSPMIASGRVLKALNPDCKVVFIGPCVAKKGEAKNQDLVGDIDFVLTFAELKDIFEALDIDPTQLKETPTTEYASKGGRLYARTGGVSVAVSDAIERLFPDKHKLFKAIQGNGIKDCKAILSKAQNGELDANFIEGMGCTGGCVGGPKALIPTDEGRGRVNSYAENSEIKVSIDSSCMNEILHRLDINAIDDFGREEKIEIFHRDFD